MSQGSPRGEVFSLDNGFVSYTHKTSLNLSSRKPVPRPLSSSFRYPFVASPRVLSHNNGRRKEKKRREGNGRWHCHVVVVQENLLE